MLCTSVNLPVPFQPYLLDSQPLIAAYSRSISFTS